MKWIAAVLLSVAAVSSAFAAGGGGALKQVHVDLGDKDSLRNGAKVFANFCQGCHSLGFMRYNRMAEDLDIPESVLLDNLMFNTDKTGDLMMSSLHEDDAKTWFGKVPPDLSLYARARGANHLFTYLTGFYREQSGKVSNLVLPGLSMPHVLAELQGWQEIDGHDEHGQPKLVLAEPGKLTAQQFDKEMTDLTRYLVYVAEPAAMVRTKVGVYIILYLALLCFILVLLKKEYWRDVH